MSYESTGIEAPSSADFIIVRRGETEIFRALGANFEAHVLWDRRLGERRVRQEPVSRDGRGAERRGLAPGTWAVHGFLLTSWAKPAPDP